MDRIEATWIKLMEDSFSEANFYFENAITQIDNKFGEGYAKDHPELISAFMSAATRANQGVVIGKCIQDLAIEVSETKQGIFAYLNSHYEDI